MKKALCFSSMLLAVLFSTISYADEPQNLDVVKKTLIAYHDSGAYQQDLAKVVMTAEDYLQQRVKQNEGAAQPEKLAIVLDIDETALSNYDDMRQRQFGGTSADINLALQQARGAPISPTLQLYQYAKQHKVAVFFVTGRRENLRAATTKNLLAAGYKDWSGLTLAPKNYQQKSIVPYKAAARKQIVARGYDVVLTMGDQQSDLQGGYADKGFKLPNPYYFLT